MCFILLTYIWLLYVFVKNGTCHSMEWNTKKCKLQRHRTKGMNLTSNLHVLNEDVFWNGGKNDDGFRFTTSLVLSINCH